MTTEDTGHDRQVHGGSARSEFARRLSALHRAAGAPSLRNVAMLAQLRAKEAGETRSALASAQRISDWLSGRNVPARFESLLPVLQVLGARAKRRTGNAGEAVNTRAWRMLWTAARSSPADATGATTQRPYPVGDYTEQHEAIFFGRRRALTTLLTMVRMSATPQRRADVIVLTGASGVGKTSLLRAALVPALRSEGGRWAVTILTAGRDPLATSARTFGDTADLAVGGPDLEVVRQWAGEARPVLIVDQFEQLYRPEIDPTERAALLIWLKQVSTIGTVLISIRSDDLVSCAQYPWLADAVQHNSFTLNPMLRPELTSVIVGPVRSCGAAVDPGVVDLLLTALDPDRPSLDRTVSSPGELAVLSATMRSLWAAHTGERIDVAAYRKVGGPAGEIARIAEHRWAELTPDEQVDARQLLLALIAVHRDGSYSRRRIPTADLLRIAARTGSGRDLVDRLIRTRLIVVEVRHADLLHDTLLSWDRLRGWIAENRAFLLWRQRIEDDAAEWCSAERDPSLLYRGSRLTTAIRHADPTANVAATEFLRASARAELGGSAFAAEHDHQTGYGYQKVAGQ
ncbi:ATP-binding protein [Nocardia miyunensis]|uniref:ATP-binding protein n=1 Tax=Nocardia miyunensis TaxID=282684 RepID=UPI00082F2400|nr:ATP-binding protein [Nocardia miyunensis]